MRRRAQSGRARPVLLVALLAVIATVAVAVRTVGGDGASSDGRNASGRPPQSTASTTDVPAASTSSPDYGPPVLPDFPTFVPDDALDAIPTGARGGVAVFGDSLTLQAWTYLEAIAVQQGRSFSGAAYGGAALCDWLPQIEADLTEKHPTELVLAFAGNNLSPCVAGPDGERVGGAELAAIYVRDARRAVELAHAADARVTLVGPPAMGVEPQATNARMLREAFTRLAADLEVSYVDAAVAVSPGGFDASLPCLPFETADLGCRDGRIVVRDDDQVHLAGPNTAGYSSGSWRYALALLG